MLNIAHMEPNSSIYGPGNRFVIWMQGCSLRCSGCWNQEMWSFREKHPIEKLALLKRIINDRSEVEGVTFLGGEPLDQFDELLWLVRQLSDHGLSIQIFTGYEMNEISESGKEAILPLTDILISGRYNKEFRDINLQWRGSSNQEVHFLSDRYSKQIIEEGNYLEIHINPDGSANLFGFPDKNARELLD